MTRYAADLPQLAASAGVPSKAKASNRPRVPCPAVATGIRETIIGTGRIFLPQFGVNPVKEARYVTLS